MKKLLAALLLLFLLPLSACTATLADTDDGTSASIDECGWKEVQSITYWYDYPDSRKTIVSEYVFSSSSEDITKEEYDNSTDTFSINPSGEIPANKDDRDSLFQELDENVGKAKYLEYLQSEMKYSKTTYTNYVIRYVFLKIYDDGSIGLQYYYDSYKEYVSVRVLPQYYEITYFEE